MSNLPPIGHVAVTVTDLAVSRPWYERLIGAEAVLDRRPFDVVSQAGSATR